MRLNLRLDLSLSHLHLGFDFFHSLVEVTLDILGNTQNGLLAR